MLRSRRTSVISTLVFGVSGLSLLAGCGNASSSATHAGAGSGPLAAGGAVNGDGGRAGTPAGGGSTTTSAGATATGSGGNAPGVAGKSAGGAGGAPGSSGGQSISAGAAGVGASLGGSGAQGSGGAAGGAGSSAAGAGGSAGAAGGSGASGGGAGTGDSTCTNSKLTSGNANRTLDVGGTSRSYVLHVPTNYTGKTRVPLVLDFHGLGGSGTQEQSSSGYQQIADREGFLIAFPNGIDNAWNIGPCCTNSRDVDDLGFAKAMVASISADGCVDPKRVYATGFSMGGGMSQYLACNAADMFAAATPASFDLLVPDEEPCMPSRPISVLAFRGTADTVVPFDGGKGSSGRVTFLGAQGSFDRWAGIDGCMQPTTTDGDCTYYEQCDGGVQIGLCVKQGGSHAPGDANVGWAFLNKFTLP